MDNPSSISRHVPKRFLQEHTAVKFIRLQWVDYSGVLHCRLITTTKCLKMAESTHQYKVPVNSMIIPLSTSPGCDASPPQVWELYPDWTTLRVCGFAPTHASVMCFLTRTGAADAFAMCPRQLLTNTMQTFKQEHDAKLLIGFEIEFVLLDEQLQAPQTIDRIEGFSMSAGIRGSNLAIVEEIFDALEASDIPVHHMHTEAEHQLEFSLEPAEPMAAIDGVMYAQETIRTIAVRHGRKATMTPRPLLQRFPANGLHMHVSVFPKDIGDCFLAGVLTKLRVLSAFGLPSYDSYHRVEDDGTGRWVGWGTENRDLPLRRIEPAHWEYRPADTTANFYLLLAALVKAGSAGLKQKMPLIWKNCRTFPEDMNEKERTDCGISENLPNSLEESINLAKDDADLPEWVGKDLLEKYVKVKEKEVEVFGRMTDEERRLKFLAFF